jgi:copper chaperone
MTTFSVPDMSCGHCTAAITKAIGALDATARVQCDLAAHKVAVQSSAPEAALIAAMEQAGYAATPLPQA